MFKHSDVLTPLKVVRHKDKSAVLATHTVKKRDGESDDESEDYSNMDMCVRIPVVSLSIINQEIADIPKFRDGLALVAGVALTENKTNRYRFIISNGFLIDSRLVDERTYFKAYIGRIRASDLRSHVTGMDIEMTLYYADTSRLETSRERDFRAELAACYMTCGYD